MTYFIKTFGCQMNVSDSERVSSFLESSGFDLAEKIEDSDLVILNTCGVRQMAEDRVFGLVRNLKKDNPKIKIVVTGCLANRKDIHRRMKDVDLFTEIKDFREKVSSILYQVFSMDSKIQDTKYEMQNTLHNKEHIGYLSINPKYKNTFSAYVPIMTGCDNFCSYCVVPYARGREVSRPAEEIVSEIKNLVAKGYKSITLLGQNVNSYCSSSKNSSADEADKKISFAKLLKKVDRIPGKFWIHFVSSHPKDMDSVAIETITKLKKVCENIHLPIQAGDDGVLRRMNRKYTQKHYLGLIRKIKTSFKKYKPDAPYSITTDIIVGFPGETKKQFGNSAMVMEKSKFDMVFFGQYSPRPGTAAWNMKDNVSIKEKEWREKSLNEILKKTALANNKKYVGEKMEVLIEKEKDGFYYGKTRTLKNVRIPRTEPGLVGAIHKVKITKAHIWKLEGSLTKQKAI